MPDLQDSKLFNLAEYLKKFSDEKFYGTVGFLWTFQNGEIVKVKEVKEEISNLGEKKFDRFMF